MCYNIITFRENISTLMKIVRFFKIILIILEKGFKIKGNQTDKSESITFSKE